ncbi:MAG: ABC transporter permease subunit [Ilumatobacteraceae bacterium]
MTATLGETAGIDRAAPPSARAPTRLPALLRRWSPASIGVAVLLAVWIVGGRAGWANGMVVTPVEAVRPILATSTRELYRRALSATVWEAVRGLLIGSVLAFGAALIATAIPSLRRSISRLAAIANAAPWVAVAPVLLVVLGRDRGPVAVAAIAVFFFVFVSTSVGLGAAPAQSHDVVTALGGSRWLRLTALQLPACWPALVDGLRLAAPASLAGAIFGEWYGAPRGLGVLLLSAMQTGRADRLWAASLLSAGCGLVAFAALAAARVALSRRYGASVTQTIAAPRRHSVARTALLEVVTGAVLIALLVTAWWVWITAAHVSPLVVPRPSRVWRDLHSNFGTYLSATGATLTTAALAFLLGAAIGLVGAAIATRVRIVAGIVVPVIVVLAATPLVALFPLLARILGYEPTTVRVLAATMVFFPVFVYTRSGLAAAGRPAQDVMHALGARPGSAFRLVDLPAAVPHIVSGCRIAAGSAVIAAVVGETLIGRTGLGVQFSYSYRLLDLPRAFGAAICIIVVSVAVFTLAGAAERAVHARWR